MADPQLTDHFRVQAVFQHASGLPEDRFVNSFCFRNDSGAIELQSFADTIVEPALRSFYFGTTDSPGSGVSIASLMTNHITSAQVRVYDLGEPPPRQPYVADFDTAVPFGAGAPLPYECAAVLSLVTTQRGPRGRGRLYIGPLSQGTVVSGSNRTAVSSTLRQTMRDAGERLLEAAGITWVVLSQANAATYEVIGGWVDDAFDTQRRRGQVATLREPWGAYAVPA